MDIFIIPILYVVVIINTLLAAVIFSRGIHERKNLLFGLIALTTGLWGVAMIGFYSAPNSAWVRYTHLFGLLDGLFFLFYTSAFPRKIKVPNFLKLFSFSAVIVIIAFLFGTDLIVGGAYPNGVYDIGSLYLFYSFVLIFFFVGGYVYQFRQLKNAKNRTEYSQIVYVLIGTLSTSSIAIIPDILLPYINIFQFTWLGPVITLIMVSSIFIAMVRHHLFNVKIILTEVFTVVILSLLFIEVVLAETVAETLLKATVLVLVSIFSYLMIKSVYRVVEAREQIEKLAKDLEKANKRLTELDQLKSEFLSIASHQMRSPLTAIKGYASLILEGTYGTVSDAVREAVDKMFQSTESMINVVEGFLNVSRIEQGRMQYTFAKEDLSELVEEVVGELTPVVSEKNLTISFTAEKADYTAYIDKDKLKQVFVNLIDNAAKYTKEGSIEVCMKRSGDVLQTTITDTGVGMTQADIGKLFHRFSRAEGASKVNTKGTGLGLYVAKEMVTAHKGKVWVESPGKGKGSTFFVEVPAV